MLYIWLGLRCSNVVIPKGERVTPSARLQNRACEFPSTRLLNHLAVVIGTFNEGI